jgi:hypothetical protein
VPYPEERKAPGDFKGLGVERMYVMKNKSDSPEKALDRPTSFPRGEGKPAVDETKAGAGKE